MTDVYNRTTIMTSCQLGQEIGNLMDKALMIDQRKMILSCLATEVKQYFIDLGTECLE